MEMSTLLCLQKVYHDKSTAWKEEFVVSISYYDDPTYVAAGYVLAATGVTGFG